MSIWKSTVVGRGLVVAALWLACTVAPCGADDFAQYDALRQSYFYQLQMGQYRQAESSARELLKIGERHAGTRPKLLSAALSMLANACAELGQFHESAELYEREWKLNEKIDGPESGSAMLAMNNLATVYNDLDRDAESEALHLRVLAIRERSLGADDINVAESLNNLGNVYRKVGRYADAERVMLRSIKIREKALGDRDTNVAKSYNNLGNIYADQARLSDAEQALLRCRAILVAALGPDHPELTANLASLGVNYEQQGRFADAEAMHRQCLRILERASGADSPRVAGALGNIAVLYIKQKRIKEAEPLLLRSIKIAESTLGPEHVETAVFRAHYGSCLERLGRLAEAQAAYEWCLAINERAYGPDHSRVAECISNLGYIAKGQGRYDEAERLLERSLQIWRKMYGDGAERHEKQVHNLAKLSELYVEQGRLPEAEQLLDRVIAARESQQLSPGSRFTALYARADVRWRLNRRAEALLDLEAALLMIESQRQQFSGAGHQQAQAYASYGPAYERMVAWQLQLDNKAAAFEAIERGRARGLIEQMTTAGVDPLVGVPADDSRRLRQHEADAQTRVASCERQLDRLSLHKGTRDAHLQAEQVRLLQELASAREQLVDAYTAIRNASPAFRQAMSQNYRPIALAEVQHALTRDDGLLLEYMLGDNAGYLCVIGPQGSEPQFHSLTVPAETAEILGVDPGPLTADRMRTILTNAQQMGLLDQLRNSSPAAQTTPRLAALWQLLVPEATREALTTDSYQRLAIVPDAVLSALPFEALVVDVQTTPKYLLDAGPPIQYGPSATILANLSSRTPADAQASPAAVLTVAGALYGQNAASAQARGNATRTRYASLGSLEPLPFTETESKWVAELFTKAGRRVADLRGDLATEKNVRANIAPCELVHFACHGLTDQEHGNLFGALALTPGSAGAGTDDDGFLTLAEIYSLRLATCELAILSACQTNVGPQQRGEGVWALSRGFLVCGAERVVASNWLVDDKAAASLISYFCGSVSQNKQKQQTADYAAALQAAKRYVRSQSGWENPYYWATFVLIGPE